MLKATIIKSDNCLPLFLLVGWKMGFEPTTFGTTIRRSNQLNYIHRIGVQSKPKISISQNLNFIL